MFYFNSFFKVKYYLGKLKNPCYSKGFGDTFMQTINFVLNVFDLELWSVTTVPICGFQQQNGIVALREPVAIKSLVF